MLKKEKVWCREAVRDDVSGMVGRSRDAFGLAAWDWWRYAGYMARGDTLTKILEDKPGGGTVGHIVLVRDPPTLYVQDLIVEPYCRRQGWASGLLSHVLDVFYRKQKYQRCVTMLMEDNTAGQLFLREMEFKCVGLVKEAYLIDRQDGLTFTLEF